MAPFWATPLGMLPDMAGGWLFETTAVPPRNYQSRHAGYLFLPVQCISAFLVLLHALQALLMTQS